MLIHFFIIPNLMAKHHARRDGAAWLIPVLARGAHRIDRSGQGWMVCRVPVALLTATVDDARSLRLPGHPCHELRESGDPPRASPFLPRPVGLDRASGSASVARPIRAVLYRV